ncbi:MAG: 16S rRNA (uracil(1498)-N(3))-methyltransferase [Gammaproteobacteria bacterium]|nr:16S rRNA (uracil(1498)-N(3))-methyltransferase [Gammaproteobacteria bacterium]
MRIPRIYCGEKLQVSYELKLSVSASRHILHVLRLKLGAPLILFNGMGGEYAAELFALDQQHAVVKINAFIEREAESPLNICLAQGISRGDKMDYTLQKAVELGVTKIVPLFTERCNVKLSDERLDKRLQHWQAVVISACEQCGRNRIPMVVSAQNFTNFIAEQHMHSGINLVLSHRATGSLSNISSETNGFTLLVGPEGGLSELEIDQALRHNFTALCLGPRILRTETAGLAAITVLQTQFGDIK